MPSSPGPEYVEHGGELTHRHPFAFTGARLRGFLLAGSQEQLQALCDRHFNAPSGGATDFRPLSRLVLLTYATLPRIASLDERDRRFGWSEEVDVAFWVPLLSTRHG